MVLFTPSLSDFDVIITLKENRSTRLFQRLMSLDDIQNLVYQSNSLYRRKMRQLDRPEDTQPAGGKQRYLFNLLVDFDPVQQYVSELMTRFDRIAFFFITHLVVV